MSLVKTVAGVVLTAALSVAAVAAAEKAPDFTLKDITGKTVSLAQFKGKTVFLDFWASWCPPCRRSIPEVEKLYEKVQGQDVVVLGINVEGDADAARKFVASKGMKYPVLLGDEKVARDYHVNGIPSFFIVDKDGAIVKQYQGYQPDMEAEWESEIARLVKSAPAAKPKRIPSSTQPTVK
jgi:peroxiredoxin